MSSQKNEGGFGWGIIMVVIGSLFLLQNFDFLDVGDVISTYWPLILIAVGIKVLYNRRSTEDDTVVVVVDNQSTDNQTGNGTTGQFSSANRFSENGIFGDIDVIPVTDDFQGGTTNNVFGDINVDLTQIQMKQPLSKINISGVFGDILIKTPRDIPIRVRANVTAGDISVRLQKRDGIFPDITFEDQNYNSAEHKLLINCTMVFGSINVF